MRNKLLYVPCKGKTYLLVKNGLILFKALVLEWRIQFAETQSCGNALCCVFCLIPSLDPLLVSVVLSVVCLALGHVLERGRVSQGHCSPPGDLLPPPCPCLLLGAPKNTQQRESGIWLLGKSLRGRKNY